jgi:hypothetical protein
MPIPDALLGPYAALAGAILIIGFLGRLLLQYIADLRAQRDLAFAGWKAQTDATNAIAAAIEARNRAEETRQLVERARSGGKLPEGGPG